MPFWQNLEMLPSSEREQAREKPKRSTEEYAESREKVKDDVQEAKEARKQNEITAEVMLYVELNEKKLKKKMREENLSDLVGELSSYDKKQQGELQKIFGEGRFNLQVKKGGDGNPQISASVDLAEGNVHETIPLNPDLQEAIITRATGNTSSDLSAA